MAQPAQQSHLPNARSLSELHSRPGLPQVRQRIGYRSPVFLQRRTFGQTRPAHAAARSALGSLVGIPRTLNLRPPANQGLRRDEILTPGDVESPSLGAYHAWQKTRDEVSATGGARQFEIFTASETSDSPRFQSGSDHSFHPKTLGSAKRRKIRNAGSHHPARRPAARGSRSDHRTGESSRPPVRRNVQKKRSRDRATEATLAHPLLARARSSMRLHREFPIILKLEIKKCWKAS